MGGAGGEEGGREVAAAAAEAASKGFGSTYVVLRFSRSCRREARPGRQKKILRVFLRCVLC